MFFKNFFRLFVLLISWKKFKLWLPINSSSIKWLINFNKGSQYPSKFIIPTCLFVIWFNCHQVKTSKHSSSVPTPPVNTKNAFDFLYIVFFLWCISSVVISFELNSLECVESKRSFLSKKPGIIPVVFAPFFITD